MLAAASPLLKSLLLQSPETDTLYLDTSFDVLKKLIKFVYDVDPIVTQGRNKREALENRRPFKAGLFFVRFGWNSILLKIEKLDFFLLKLDLFIMKLDFPAILRKSNFFALKL